MSSVGAVIKYFVIQQKQNEPLILKFPALKRDAGRDSNVHRLVNNFRDVHQLENIWFELSHVTLI